MNSAIITRHLSPNKSHSSRVSALYHGKEKVLINWDHTKDADENHKLAARALADKLARKAETELGIRREDTVWQDNFLSAWLPDSCPTKAVHIFFNSKSL